MLGEDEPERLILRLGKLGFRQEQILVLELFVRIKLFNSILHLHIVNKSVYHQYTQNKSDHLLVARSGAKFGENSEVYVDQERVWNIYWAKIESRRK